MPQIEQLAGTYSSQIFWLLVIFALAFFIIGKGMLPRVMDTMADRDSRIAERDCNHREATLGGRTDRCWE